MSSGSFKSYADAIGTSLSVVMPVRDVAPYLDRCIESILAQSFKAFEFVILDDGSVDDTREILRRWARADRRIRVIEHDHSLGPAGSSNRVVREARGAIIARMDGDDIAHPERLERQMAALASNPEACLVGSLWEGIDGRGRCVRPSDRSSLVKPKPFPPFAHGSIMFRRRDFERVGGYRPGTDFWEDLDLYRRMSSVGSLVVIPKVLYQHRASVLSTRLTSDREAVEAAVDGMYRKMRAGPAAPEGGKRLPRVFVSLASTRLWAGGRTRTFRRVLSRAALQPDWESAAVLAWSLWGSVSPRTLRLALRTFIRLRNALAMRAVDDRSVFRWNPPAPSPALEKEWGDSDPIKAALVARRTNRSSGGRWRLARASSIQTLGPCDFSKTGGRAKFAGPATPPRQREARPPLR
jgi:glycosyltransferase involved in cell wall biosynthesis